MVAGFSFAAKAWGVAMVDGLRAASFNDRAFEQLVLPPARKRLIEALVLSHGDEGREGADLIAGTALEPRVHLACTSPAPRLHLPPQVLKLPALPRSLMLAPALALEELDFSAAAPRASHTRELRFALRRAGELRGLALHMELLLVDEGAAAGAAAGAGAEAEASRPPAGQEEEETEEEDRRAGGGAAAGLVSSAEAGSHWHNVFVLLEPTEVQPGAQLLVRTTAELGGPAPPRYTFEAWLGGAEDADAPPEAMRRLGGAEYP